jgi:hypothetical protein
MNATNFHLFFLFSCSLLTVTLNQGFFTQKDYKMFPPSVDWDNINWSTRRPQMDFPVQVYYSIHCSILFCSARFLDYLSSLTFDCVVCHLYAGRCRCYQGRKGELYFHNMNSESALCSCVHPWNKSHIHTAMFAPYRPGLLAMLFQVVVAALREWIYLLMGVKHGLRHIDIRNTMCHMYLMELNVISGHGFSLKLHWTYHQMLR